MNLDQLRTFRLAAELESFSKAADERFLSQPAVSLQIRQIEREFGAKLFERTGKRVRLTPAGGAFLEFARSVEALQVDLRRNLQSLDANFDTVAIGCSPSSAKHYVPLLLHELRDLHPEVHVRVMVFPVDQASAALLRGELDFVFTSNPAAEPRLAAAECLVSRLFIIGPADHPLTQGQRASPQEIAAYPFAVLPTGYLGPQLFRQWAENHDVNINVALEMGGFDGLIEAVRQGLGLALVSEAALYEDLKAGRIGIVRTSGFPLEFTVYLARRAGTELSPAAQIVHDLILNGRWRSRLPSLGDRA